ncbi:MAG: insulinase family protein [Ignavibacteriae bacterium]|nr:insulinase family protein [Ignavibacteriota bacterium]
MNYLRNFYRSLILLLILTIPVIVNGQTRTVTEGKYTYKVVDGDPLNARIYTLGNGLTVMMTVYKDEPRIQTYIPVKAGSKNDPADATGLAHYLEHMLFKGTSRIGTRDFSVEKPLVDEIIDLYEQYRSTTDPGEREMIYNKIDSVSLLASSYAIANEYDKMCEFIGATGTNAWTWMEETVYVNNVPSNQLDNFITMEAERFREPVMRLFHTELEAVYEEKNRSLDNDYNKAYDKMYEELFKKHQYGTQTTIGTIDHLKNPSIKKVLEYYDTYYVPNNMGIVLAGDFDPDEAIRIVDEKFSYMQPKDIPVYTPPAEDPITQHREYTVYGPNAETVFMGYRFGGRNSSDFDYITLIDMILSNSSAGLIDLNLVQGQKVLSAGSSVSDFKDYCVFELSGTPREGQSLEDVKDKILSQVDLIKKGDFPDWMLDAVINNLKLDQTQGYESNRNRGYALVDAFKNGVEWEDYVNTLNRLSKITKQQLVDFANEKFGDNYIAVYKKTGEDPDKQQVDKPKITPINLNRDEKSPFVEAFEQNVPANIEPVFLDYKDDIGRFNVDNDVPVYYLKNTENNLFNLYYILDMGTNNDKSLGVAIAYLELLGTDKYTPAEIQQEFFKLGCSYSVFSSTDQVYVSLSGLNENFVPALTLFEDLLANAKPNKEALDNMIQDIFKARDDNKLSKNSIRNAMFSYGRYGKKSPATNILSADELNALKPSELTNKIKDLLSYKHKIFYYGPESEAQVKDILNENHKVPSEFKEYPPETKFTEQPTNRRKVYVVNYDMVQAEIVMMSKKGKYDKNIEAANELFNNYFGTLTFTEIRESKALAYSAFAFLTSPRNLEDSKYFYSYIGTQADKLPEAMAGMTELIKDMPLAENSFNASKSGILNQIQTERITKADILFNYQAAQKLGLDYDIRRDVYSQVKNMTMSDLKNFHDSYIANSDYTILVLGAKDKLDIETLKKYGDVEFLTLEDIFGY